MEFIQKHIAARDIMACVGDIVEFFDRLEKFHDKYYIIGSIEYIFNTSELRDMTDFLKELDVQSSQKNGEKYVTFEEFFVQKGIKEERKNQKLAITRRMLARNCDANTVKTIREILEISDEDVDEALAQS